MKTASTSVYRLAFYIVTFAVITACSSLPKQPSDSTTHWQLHGKIGIKTPQNSQSALINWQQADDKYNIVLSGPFGAGAVKINGDVSGVSLKRAGQPTLHAKDANALIQENLGWALPIEQARYWVRGLPDPTSPSQVSNDVNGNLKTIAQNGWLIDYRINQSLPKRVKLSNSAFGIKLTLIIKKWH